VQRIAVEALGESLTQLLAGVRRGESYEIVEQGQTIAVLGPPSGESTLVAEERGVYAAESPPTDTALTRLLGTTSTRDVLAVFMLEPAARVHQREIARRAGVGLRSAQIALERLESAGLLVSTRDGNRRYYEANRTARFEELRAILSKEFGLGRLLREALKPFAEQIERAFLFGSTATGTDRVDSDVDLLIVGEVRGDALAPVLASVERKIGREIDLLLYRPEQFSDRLAHERHFASSVVNAPHIDIIGGSDDS